MHPDHVRSQRTKFIQIHFLIFLTISLFGTAAYSMPGKFDQPIIEKNHKSISENQITLSDQGLTKEVEEKETLMTGFSQIASETSIKEAKVEELNKLIEAKETEIKSIEEDLEKVLEKAKKGEMVVRIAGMIFSKDEKPRLRVVSPEERVTKSEWASVNKEKIKKLVYLSENEDVAKQVFALVRGMENHESLNHPIYQPFASQEEDFDIDLVLNVNGLTQTTDFIQSLITDSQTKEERASVLRFLKDKYTALQAAGLAEIPSSLRDKVIEVIEGMEIEQHETSSIVEPLIQYAVINDFIDLETIQENIKVDAAGLQMKVIDSIIDSITRSADETAEEDDKGTDEKKEEILEALQDEDFVTKLIGKEEGSDEVSAFAQAFDITSLEDFKEKFVDELNKLLESGDHTTSLSMIQNLALAFVQSEMQDVKGLDKVMGSCFSKLSDMLSGKTDENLSPADGKENSEKDSAPVEDEAGKDVEAVKEKTKDQRMSPVKEKKSEGKPSGTEEELDAMLFEEIQTILQDNFEGIEVSKPEDIVKTINKLTGDYQQTYMELNTLQLEGLKTKATEKLMEAGLEKDEIKASIGRSPDRMDSLVYCNWMKYEKEKKLIALPSI